LRLLQYLRPYRGHLLLTAALMVGFALTSGISIGIISPFVKILFTPRHAAEAPSALPAPIAAVTGLDATAPPAASEAAPHEEAKRGNPETAQPRQKGAR